MTRIKKIEKIKTAISEGWVIEIVSSPVALSEILNDPTYEIVGSFNRDGIEIIAFDLVGECASHFKLSPVSGVKVDDDLFTNLTGEEVVINKTPIPPEGKVEVSWEIKKASWGKGKWVEIPHYNLNPVRDGRLYIVSDEIRRLAQRDDFVSIKDGRVIH